MTCYQKSLASIAIVKTLRQLGIVQTESSVTVVIIPNAHAGYTSDEYRRGARHLGIRWCVNDKRKPGKNLSSNQKKRNR